MMNHARTQDGVRTAKVSASAKKKANVTPKRANAGVTRDGRAMIAVNCAPTVRTDSTARKSACVIMEGIAGRRMGNADVNLAGWVRPARKFVQKATLGLNA